MLMLICLTDMGCVLQNAEEVLQGLLAVQAISLEDVTSDNDLQRLQQPGRTVSLQWKAETQCT